MLVYQAMVNIMNRIEKLRLDSLNLSFNNTEFFYKFFRTQPADSNSISYESYAESYYAAFSSLTPCIGENELIVGRINSNMSDAEISEWNDKYREIAHNYHSYVSGGQDSHMAIDYDTVLSVGLNGIIARIDGYLKSCTEDSRPFYNSCKRCLEAVIRHSENYGEAAEHIAVKTNDEKRKEELLNIARICRKVPAEPAGSFYEAVQSVSFITYALSLNPLRPCTQQFQLGHPDKYLYPFYEADIKSGSITKEFAQLLLDCLGIQINMRVHNGLSSGYMVGGRDKYGNAVYNDLTMMCMQVIDDIRLVYPSVGLCYNDEIPDNYLKKACEILTHGRSHPAIFNDDIISEGLRYYGVPENECHDYIHSTCVEITPAAASNVWVASPYTNMAQLLLSTMDKEYDSFDEHLNTILNRLDKIIENNFNSENAVRKKRADRSMNPLLSCVVNDCLERGLDIERGGAKYNWIMPSFVGMANLVDSLYALKKIVYDNKELSVCEFKKILDANFEGHQEMRLRILNEMPKYGNDIDEIDSYFIDITSHIVEECKKYNGLHSSGRLIPSVFCWVMHARFGNATGATPDGRCAGFPLGDGSGPCQGREMNGPTASILSSTKWDHSKLIGGVAVNMKFSKSMLGDKSIDVMMSLIKTYIKRGGFEIQINVTDRELLEKARKNPEEHRDLVVRIGGYSDYFTKLSPEMQSEVMLRTEHII